LIEQLVERAVGWIVTRDLRPIQPAAVSELIEVLTGRIFRVEVGAVERHGLPRRLPVQRRGDGDKKRQRAKQGTMRVHQDAPPGKAFWRAVLARHASPQSVSEQSGSQQRSASEPAKAF